MKGLKLLLILSISMFAVNLAIANDMNVKAENMLKDYMNETNQKVKQADMPEVKRLILNNSLTHLDNVMQEVENMPGVSKDNLAAVQAYRNKVQNKINELNGKDGYERVPDNQLNAFSNYVMQDLEQADRVLTISLTTALLVVLILLLL